MRRLLLLVMCMVGLATTLVVLAQPPAPAEPLVGTWRLNPAQTRASAAAPLIETRLGPHEWLVTYLADGVQYMTMRKVGERGWPNHASEHERRHARR